MKALRTWSPTTLAASLALALMLEGIEPANDNHVNAQPAGGLACAAHGSRADRTALGSASRECERDGAGYEA